MNKKVTPEDITAGEFDDVVLATGVAPRTPKIPGIDNKKVVGYIDVLKGKVTVGKTVAVIGAGMYIVVCTA